MSVGGGQEHHLIETKISRPCAVPQKGHAGERAKGAHRGLALAAASKGMKTNQL